MPLSLVSTHALPALDPCPSRLFHLVTLFVDTNHQFHRLEALDTALDARDLDLLLRRVRRSEELSEPIHLSAFCVDRSPLEDSLLV